MTCRCLRSLRATSTRGLSLDRDARAGLGSQARCSGAAGSARSHRQSVDLVAMSLGDATLTCVTDPDQQITVWTAQPGTRPTAASAYSPPGPPTNPTSPPNTTAEGAALGALARRRTGRSGCRFSW